MKHLISSVFILFICLLPGTDSFAQPVPPKVLQAFQERFPEAEKTDWDTESESEFEVEFRLKNHEVTAWFNPEGRWLKTETVLSRAEVPVEVGEALERDYPNSELLQAILYEEPTSGILYGLALQNGKEHHRVLYRRDGTLVNPVK